MTTATHAKQCNAKHSAKFSTPAKPLLILLLHPDATRLAVRLGAALILDVLKDQGEKKIPHKIIGLFLQV